MSRVTSILVKVGGLGLIAAGLFMLLAQQLVGWCPLPTENDAIVFSFLMIFMIAAGFAMLGSNMIEAYWMLAITLAFMIALPLVLGGFSMIMFITAGGGGGEPTVITLFAYWLIPASALLASLSGLKILKGDRTWAITAVLVIIVYMIVAGMLFHLMELDLTPWF